MSFVLAQNRFTNSFAPCLALSCVYENLSIHQSANRSSVEPFVPGSTIATTWNEASGCFRESTETVRP